MDTRVDSSWRRTRETEQPWAITIFTSSAIWLVACGLAFYQASRSSSVDVMQAGLFWVLAVAMPLNVLMADRGKASHWTTPLIAAATLIVYLNL